MGNPEKYLIIVEPRNTSLREALATAYQGPQYRVIADRRANEQRRRSSRSGNVQERRRRRADVSPFASVAAADTE